MNDKNEFVKLDEWAEDLIVDPLSKEPLALSKNENMLRSPYGAVYPVVNGIYDLRLLKSAVTADTIAWEKGQKEYENSLTDWNEYDKQDFAGELAGVAEVYDEIPITGRCLDVGGHQGRLRAFLSPEQEYMSCDPFISVFDSIGKSKKLVETYPFLLEPVNFVCCQAEHLPFSSRSFDTVHMRSVIDHFMNPELALKEAFRVMVHDGQLVIGLYVRGGKSGSENVWARPKEAVKNVFSHLGVHRWDDHHTWHPTYKELEKLLAECGFKVVNVHWQRGTRDSVCYIKAKKAVSTAG